MKSPRRGQLALALIPECPLRTLTFPAPVPAARARSNGARRFHPEDSAYARWREEAAIAIRRQWVAAPLVGPVELKAVFILARPETRPTWCPKDVWASGARFRHAPGCGPDVDNFLKAVMDALQVPRELRTVKGADFGWPLRDDGAVAVSAQEKWIASSTEAARTVVGIRAVGWTEAERDAYRGFAIAVGAHFAPPGAEDLIGQHLRPGDLADLAGQVMELRAERDRLARVLRCERGEWAPEGPSGAGWTWHPEDWEWTGVAGARSEDEEPINLYVRHRAYWSDEDDQDDNAWAWLVVEQIGQGDEGDTLEAGTAPTALEAIEAAGAAVERARGAR